MVFLKLTVATLLPVFFSIFFYLAENKKNGRFAKLTAGGRQAIIGITFGCLAIISTEYGISTQGVVLNVRDAAPLTAGLLFGAPAGVLAGLIGGVERWFSGVGEFSRLSCTMATILAGLFGAWIRFFLQDNKRSSWLYGLAVGITTEVLHMILLFITKMSTDIEQAFYVVQHCSVPMILANGISVMLAARVISFLAKEKRELIEKKPERVKISQTFQTRLTICVLLAFSLTGFFTYSMQTKIAYTNIDSLLSTSIEDVKKNIIHSSDRNLLAVVRMAAAELIEDRDIENTDLEQVAEKYDLQEVNLVDSSGIVVASSLKNVVGFDMNSNQETAEFLVLLEGETELVQDLRDNSYGNPDEGLWKFAGVALSDGRFLQVGCKAERFQKDIDLEISGAAKNRHVGKTGWNIICNAEGLVVSDRGDLNGEKINLNQSIGANVQEGVRFETEIAGEEVFCMYSKSEGYFIISVLPEKEGFFTRDVALYLLLFMELLVFATLFALIVYLVKKIVVDNIRRVNESLEEITGGNLDVKIDVRTSEEFASLSDDINSTVFTLKKYIEDAAAKIDQELRFAKKIQHSALPSVFPPYPNRNEFSIYAMMDTAKEVGGDFYDFYMLGEDKLAFVVADVSGKGIPAAMFMMTTKTLIKSYTESGAAVDAVFTAANDKLCENNDAEMFVTAWMGILDIKTGVLTYANAGHNPPVLCRKNGSFEYFRSKRGLVLAAMEGIRYEKFELQLKPGDVIYFYTDGVTEAKNKEDAFFGEERLLRSLNEKDGLGVEEICKKVKDDLDAFTWEAEQFDDITMLCVKLNERENQERIELTPSFESIERAAMFLAENMEKSEIPNLDRNKMMVAMDEIYSNIVQYSGADWAEIVYNGREGEVVLIFRDNGIPYNPLEQKAPDTTLSSEEREIGGLGIHMVRQMMDEVEYTHENDCNVLTLKMRCV